MSSFLKVNEHPIERAIRVLVGAGLVAASVTGRLGAWGYIGVVPILTGLMGTCPLYTLIGVSTCPVRKTST